MLKRRLAVAIGLLLAVIASQLPEYVQQYRQRLGGAVDELKAIMVEFDQEAASLSLSHSEALARLRANSDRLAQDRGSALEASAAREERLERQQAAFARSGPVSQYLVLLEYLDIGLAERAYADFQPAVPVTSAGLMAGVAGLLAGWGATSGLARAVHRLRARRADAAAPAAQEG